MARALGVSQPTVPKSIQRLPAEGVAKLFDR